MQVSRVDLAGVPVDPVTSADVLRFVCDCCLSRRPGRVVTVNAEYVVMSQSDAEFRRVLQGADLATADSAGILWALRRRGIHLTERVGGADLIWSISEQAARMGHRVFLLGGADGVAKAAAARLQAAYPSLRVSGAHPGSPIPAEVEGIVDLIRRSRADIVFVAFGAPAQDMWIARYQEATGASFAMGVGGSFDYVAGAVRRAPLWMRRKNVEWLWRLIRQPWRWRRMLALPRFVWLAWRHERVTGRGQNVE